MSSQAEIINLALFKLAQSVGIPSIHDKSKAADVFGRLWAPTRDRVLAARVWPWALKTQAMSVAAQAPDPGWLLRYAYPNDCITAKAVTNENGLRVVRNLAGYCDTNFLRSGMGRWAFDWDTSYGEQGTSIHSDVAGAYLVYVARVEDPGRYPPQFVNAFACLLAAEGAGPMIGEVGLQNKRDLMQEYNVALTEAGAHDYGESESQLAETYTTPAMAARGGY